MIESCADPHARKQLDAHANPHIILKYHRLKIGSLISHRHIKQRMAVVDAGNQCVPPPIMQLIADGEASARFVNLAAGTK